VRDAWAFAIHRDRRELSYEEFLQGAWDEVLERVIQSPRL